MTLILVFLLKKHHTILFWNVRKMRKTVFIYKRSSFVSFVVFIIVHVSKTQYLAYQGIRKGFEMCVHVLMEVKTMHICGHFLAFVKCNIKYLCCLAGGQCFISDQLRCAGYILMWVWLCSLFMLQNCCLFRGSHV